VLACSTIDDSVDDMIRMLRVSLLHQGWLAVAHDTELRAWIGSERWRAPFEENRFRDEHPAGLRGRSS
jgi:hypothetical protein